MLCSYIHTKLFLNELLLQRRINKNHYFCDFQVVFTLKISENKLIFITNSLKNIYIQFFFFLNIR